MFEIPVSVRDTLLVAIENAVHFLPKKSIWERLLDVVYILAPFLAVWFAYWLGSLREKISRKNVKWNRLKMIACDLSLQYRILKEFKYWIEQKDQYYSYTLLDIPNFEFFYNFFNCFEKDTAVEKLYHSILFAYYDLRGFNQIIDELNRFERAHPEGDNSRLIDHYKDKLKSSFQDIRTVLSELNKAISKKDIRYFNELKIEESLSARQSFE